MEAQATKAAEAFESQSQARAQLDSIRVSVERMEHLNNCDGAGCELTGAEIMYGLDLYDDGSGGEASNREAYHDEDAAREAADPLSVEVRSDWHTPGDPDAEDGEYRICLCTGGPAVQIIGTVGRYGEPDTARLQHQDWFTPWTDCRLTSEEEADLVAYAQRYLGF